MFCRSPIFSLLLACVSSGTVAASDPERKSTATTSFAWMPKCAETIVVPHGVESIQEKAFSGCSSLTSITLPDTVTSIHDKAFAGCSSLTSINIPSSVTTLGNDVFSACSALTSIVLPESISSIGGEAFYGCSSLTSIKIPSSVVTIGWGAFNGCVSLSSVTFGRSSKLKTIGDWSFFGCSSLGTAHGITLPQSLTRIGDYAFKSCSSLRSINIPHNVGTIGSQAFRGCSSLTSIAIPHGLRLRVGSNKVFDSETTVTLMDRRTSIDAQNWKPKCAGAVVVPDGVDAIGEKALDGCTALTSIIFSDSVSSIGEKAFYGCSALTSLTIPDGVKQIGRMAFGGCPSLASVSLPHDVKLRFEDTFPLKTIVTWRPQQLADFDGDASGDVDPGEVDTFVESLTGFASPEAKIEMAKAILAQYDTDSSGTLSAREMGAAKGKSWSAFVAAASQKPPPMHPSTRRLFIDGLGLSDGVHVADVIWASIVAVLVAALLAVATFFCGQAQAQPKPQAGGCCCCSSMTKADLTVAARRSFIFIAVVLIISILAYVSYNYLGGRIDVNAASTLYSFDADRT